MKNRASLTAEYMALFRALESSRCASSRLFKDPFAAIFLHQWRRWLYGIARFDLGRRLVERLLDRAAPGARAAGIARTKWIDDEVAAALETAAQLVLLGAGFDTRAYRLTSAARATTFELDRPETSVAKQAALKKATGSLPEQVRFVSIDFNSQSVAEVLTQAGFDPARPACFIWEGVTNYLTAEAVDNALREIRQTAPECILLFTYIDRGVLEQPERFLGAAKLMARLQSYGEPWTFGICPEELDGYLAARGFRLITDLSVADVWQRAGRSTSGTRGYEFYQLASARMPC
ncbi:MAG TPA: SAM-dependent methyltransferase [Bryobacteraceae bacterium]|nr:SAM-dependent methyltransferase [Bryobacteraceae bacterium]